MLRIRTLIILFSLGLCATREAFGAEFAVVTTAGKRVTICRVDVKKERVALFLNDDVGRPLKSFSAVEAWLNKSGSKLLFAMNAGMFERDLRPVGLFVSDSHQLAPLNLASGEGNFFLKPNGVFMLTQTGVRIVSSDEYLQVSEAATLATQSGPLLIRSGRIHPAFHSKSTSRLFRNGVGVSSPEAVIFAISEEPVSFYEFATLFRDVLHCPDALFLDGTVSSLYSPLLRRNDRKIDLGPMIGVVE